MKNDNNLKQQQKEYVYVVICNNVDEVMGEVEGAFRDYKDAQKCFEDVKKNWREWADDDIVDETDDDDYYQLGTSSETMEVKIDRVELK